ncbi:MAG: DNA mismatch repair endonuclease MutL [Oscillospiraceae bacterium]|nr:DNA mismatch repair endonuclease MutL [Oscillospiraceae bacterium]
MAIIYQLSPHVADLIAAGEVVERPGSVVKELVENSIDAGSSHITVEIQNGGMTLIRISDDGCGMDRQDAQTAFLRHATSKIREEEDLAAIGTLGFRGEALAAIAAVSRITLLTRPVGSMEGTSLTLEGGVIAACDPAGCPKGTTLVVRDLFYNTPARLKFMKSDVAEGSAVFSAVQRQAIAHPEISFHFLKDGQEQFSTAGDGVLLSAVYEALGRQIARDMLPVESRWEKNTVQGFVSLPTASRGNRTGQLFFVNGRYVKSRTMTAALEEAYKNQIMVGRYPSCVLNLEMPLGSVDVNVHPAKTEVRFLSEKNVFDCVYYGVLATLSRASGKQDVTFPAQRSEPTPAAHPAQKQDFFKTMRAEDYRGMASAMGAPITPSKPACEALLPKKSAQPALHEEVRLPAAETPASGNLPIFAAKAAASEPPEAPQEALPLPGNADYRVVGEVLDAYILVEEPGAILLIDKHAAHERILFEKLKREDTRAMSQVLLSPIPALLNREESAALLENAALLRQCGYVLEDFGDHTVLIREIPDDIAPEDAEAVLAAMASDLLCGRRTDPDGLRDSLLHTIACKAAIKAGWHTEPAERDALVREVMTRDDLKYCPHGRPICIRMTDGSLRRQFKRS